MHFYWKIPLYSRLIIHDFRIFLREIISFQIVFAYFRNLCYNMSVMFIAFFAKANKQLRFL